jgi:Peptidase family M23
MRQSLGALFFSLVAAPAVASDITLQWPIDCSLGETCHIQQYVDHDPGPGAEDYRCEPLSYSGHKGTDIALPYLADMRRGVAVRAAAAGVVKGLRDSMPDAYATEDTAENLKGRECGNGVVISHDDGWETQYCHMKRGSVRIKKGQKVQAGEQLGEVGLSGKTQFPHLHLSLRHKGKVVDPFAPQGHKTCEAEAEEPGLWASPPTYEAGAFLGAGFSSYVPDFREIKTGDLKVARLPDTAPALVFWAYAFGGQKADRIRLSISGPSGFFSVHEIALERNQAQFFRASGKRLRDEAWVQGTYEGVAVFMRGDEEVDRISRIINVR